MKEDNEFVIEIVEIRRKYVSVTAIDSEEAEDLVSEQYHDGDIELTTSDIVGIEFTEADTTFHYSKEDLEYIEDTEDY